MMRVEGGVEIMDLASGARTRHAHALPLSVCGSRWVTPGRHCDEDVLELRRAGAVHARLPVPPNRGQPIVATLTSRDLIIPSREREVLVFDEATGQPRLRLSGHDLGPSGDGPLFVAPLDLETKLLTCDGATFRVWDLARGTLERAAPVPAHLEVRAMYPSPKGDLFVYAATSTKKTKGTSSLFVAGVDDLETKQEIEGRRGAVRDAIFLAGGELVVVARDGAPLRVLTTKNWRVIDALDVASAGDDIATLHAMPGSWSFLATGERGVFYVFGVTWPERVEDVSPSRPGTRIKSVAPAPARVGKAGAKNETTRPTK